MERKGALPPGYAKQQGLINLPAFNIPDVTGATIVSRGLVIKSNDVGPTVKVDCVSGSPFSDQLALIVMSPSWNPKMASCGNVTKFSARVAFQAECNDVLPPRISSGIRLFKIDGTLITPPHPLLLLSRPPPLSSVRGFQPNSTLGAQPPGFFPAF